MCNEYGLLLVISIMQSKINQQRTVFALVRCICALDVRVQRCLLQMKGGKFLRIVCRNCHLRRADPGCVFGQVHSYIAPTSCLYEAWPEVLLLRTARRVCLFGYFRT